MCLRVFCTCAFCVRLCACVCWCVYGRYADAKEKAGMFVCVFVIVQYMSSECVNCVIKSNECFFRFLIFLCALLP